MTRPNITRGQWAVDDRIDEQRQEGFWIDCAPTDGTEPEEIALASIATVDPGQAKANAQAIAAVPALLEALEGLLLSLEDHHSGMNTTRPFQVTFEMDEERISKARAALIAAGYQF